jgi:hypothetical protein
LLRRERRRHGESHDEDNPGAEVHRLTISRRRRDRASGAARLALALWFAGASAACGGAGPGLEAPAPGRRRAYTADQVFTVGWKQARYRRHFPPRARSIVLRHGPGQHRLRRGGHPGERVQSAGGEQVTLTVRPLPGIYGVTLERDAALSAPVTLTFKYPVHFGAPSDSRARSPPDVLFEQALVVALAEDDGARFQTLRSTRPASDNLQAVVSTLGRYQMVAPR